MICRKAVFALLLVVGLTQSLPAQESGQIEPKAGTWKTWVISSGKDYRVPPPPGDVATRNEFFIPEGFQQLAGGCGRRPTPPVRQRNEIRTPEGFQNIT